MKLYKFPKVHFTKEDLKPLLEKESKPENNCKIDYLNDLGFVCRTEYYHERNINDGVQRALFRRRILEINKFKLSGVYITFNGVKNYIKF